MTGRRNAIAAVLLLAGCARGVRTEPAPLDPSAARAEIAPLFAEMMAAANAHDTDRHLAAYLRSPSLVFVVNDEAIHGWDALRVRQREWWQDGKSDATYQLAGAPEYTVVAPGVVVETYFLVSRRSAPGGGVREGRLGVTDVWHKGADGWRIVSAHESVVSR